MKNTLIVIGVVVALILSVVSISGLFTGEISVIVENIKDLKDLGAFPGPEIYANLNVHGTLIKGDGTGLATTTTATAYTFIEKDLQPYSLIDIMQNVGNASFTLPATSTMFGLLGGSGIGSNREWLIHNATTSTNTLTLVAGAGMDLVAVTANDDVIDAGEYTRLTCSVIPYRTTDNENIVCIVDELINAD